MGVRVRLQAFRKMDVFKKWAVGGVWRVGSRSSQYDYPSPAGLYRARPTKIKRMMMMFMKPRAGSVSGGWELRGRG